MKARNVLGASLIAVGLSALTAFANVNANPATTSDDDNTAAEQTDIETSNTENKTSADETGTDKTDTGTESGSSVAFKDKSFGVFQYDVDQDGNADIRISGNEVQKGMDYTYTLWKEMYGTAPDGSNDGGAAPSGKSLRGRVEDLENNFDKNIDTKLSNRFERTKSYGPVEIANGDTITFSDIDPSYYIADVDVTFAQNYGSLPTYELNNNELKVTFSDPLPSNANGKISIRNIDVTYSAKSPIDDKTGKEEIPEDTDDTKKDNSENSSDGTDTKDTSDTKSSSSGSDTTDTDKSGTDSKTDDDSSKTDGN